MKQIFKNANMVNVPKQWQMKKFKKPMILKDLGKY
jgi:hypothetical protein